MYISSPFLSDKLQGLFKTLFKDEGVTPVASCKNITGEQNVSLYFLSHYFYMRQTVVVKFAHTPE